jgi:hypothetical protein
MLNEKLTVDNQLGAAGKDDLLGAHADTEEEECEQVPDALSISPPERMLTIAPSLTTVTIAVN